MLTEHQLPDPPMTELQRLRALARDASKHSSELAEGESSIHLQTA